MKSGPLDRRWRMHPRSMSADWSSSRYAGLDPRRRKSGERSETHQCVAPFLSRNVLFTREDFARIPRQRINCSTDCQLDRLADPAEHFHERIDGELGRFLIHHVGYTRARDHQNLGGLSLL